MSSAAPHEPPPLSSRLFWGILAYWVFAAFYLGDRRLWPPVVAHGLADLASLTRFVGTAS